MFYKLIITLVIINLHVSKQSKHSESIQHSNKNELLKSNSYENILFDEHELRANKTGLNIIKNTHTKWNDSIYWSNRNATMCNFGKSYLELNYEHLSKILICKFYHII